MTTTTTNSAITTGPWIEVDSIPASDLPQEYMTVVMRTWENSLLFGYRVCQYEADGPKVWKHNIWCRVSDAAQVSPVWIAHIIDAHQPSPTTKR